VTLVIPDVVVAAAWTLVLGQQGIVNAGSSRCVQIASLYSWWGLIFVMTLNSYVYAFVMILVGLKAMDRNLEEAALSLGSRCRACSRRDAAAHPAVDLRRGASSSSRT
jgi:iron(III) transport system permease protein